MKNKLVLGYEYAVKDAFKNITKLIRIYRMFMKPAAVAGMSREKRAWPKQWQWALLAVGILLVGAGLVLFSWSSARAAGEKPVRIRYVFSSIDEEERNAMEQAVSRFNASNPDIQVVAVPYLWEGYANHDAFVRLLALEDTSVDVYRLDLPWIPEFAWPGWLLPLDEWLTAVEQGAFVESALEGGRFRGQLYGLPISLNGNLLFYRKDLLKRHGLRPPETIGELANQAHLIQASEEISIGLALHAMYFYNDVFPFLWAGGGDVLSEREGVVLDSPQNIRTVEALSGLFRGRRPVAPPLKLFHGAWRRSYREPETVFAAGEAVFLVTWAPQWSYLQGPSSTVRGRIGVAPIPGVDPGNKGGSNLGSWYLAVSRFSRHPNEAVTFLRYMTSPGIQRLLLEQLAEVPSRRDLLMDPEIRDRYPWLEMCCEVLVRARLRPRVPNERKVGGIIEGYLHRVVSGDLQVGEAIARAASEVEAVLVSDEPFLVAELPYEEQPERRYPAWTWPLFLRAVLLLLLVGVLAALFVLRFRYVRTIRSKLILFGTATILVLILVASGLAIILAFRDQDREKKQTRAFYHQQLRKHAETIGKHLSLSTSIIADLEPKVGANGAAPAISQLMMTGQFSEDLLFLQLLDEDGGVLHSDRDPLFLGTTGEPSEYPPPPDLRQRIRRHSLSLYEWSDARNTRHLEMLVPVFRHGVHVGALRLGVSQKTYRDQLRKTEARHQQAVAQIERVTVLLTGGLLMLGIGGILVMSRRLAGPIVELTGHAERIRQGDLQVQVIPRSQDEVGTLARTMAEMVQGLRDRDFIKDAFGRFITPELAERFIRDPEALRLGGHVQRVTIMMSDLRGYSSLSERLGPEKIVVMLNRYLAHMTDVILSHNGMINEFIGDAILVLFGVPVVGEDDAERAIRCAIAMQRGMIPFNRQNRDRGLPELAMGIGLNTGEVVAGNIGSEQRVKYGVIGSPVNLTARIESLTAGGQVLLSRATYDEVRNLVEVTGPMKVLVKGSTEPLEVYELFGIQGKPELSIRGLSKEQQVEVVLQAECFIVRGERVDEEAIGAIIRRLGFRRLEAEVGRPLRQLDNIRLRLELRPGRWTVNSYAKVVSVRDGTTTLEFTSLAEQDREEIERIVLGGSAKNESST